MRKTFSVVLLYLLAFALFLAAQQQGPCLPGPCPACDPVLTGDPLKVLRDGNDRFSDDKPKHFHQSISCVRELACCQKPLAVILSCSDSRVPPEVAFDLGIGDLFVVREPGNVATPVALGSIYYGVGKLKAQLVVVIGHRRCGAVEAAFCLNQAPQRDIWKLIHPAVRKRNYVLNPCPDPLAVDRTKWDQAGRNNLENMTALVENDRLTAAS